MSINYSLSRCYVFTDGLVEAARLEYCVYSTKFHRSSLDPKRRYD